VLQFQFLQRRRADEVEYLTLNRPEVRNAFNEEMIAELGAWAAGVAGDTGVRAVVMSGAGAVFCAGADAAWMKKQIAYGEDDNLRDAAAASQLFAALDALPMPMIARVHGAALGGGAGLAAICDIVIAADNAVFGFTEVRLGLIPAVIAPFVMAKIGRSASRELFLTGERFGAARARELGLVHSVVPLASLDVEVARYRDALLCGAPGAIAAAKQLIAEVGRRGAADVAMLCAEAIAARRASEEGQEGIKAFLEKREPSWRLEP
jgi:methylglutaconyl-CoA hydratase